MDGEIILNRGDTNVMKLDDNEQAIMDEIQISVQKPQPVKRPQARPQPPPQQFQEDIDLFANPNKQAPPPVPQPEIPVDYGEVEEEPDMDFGMGGYGGDEERPSPGFTTIDEEKSDLVNKLGRLEKKGFSVNKRLTVYSPIDELRTEVKRITYSIEVDKSVKFSRRMLIACVTGLEFLNKKYSPFDLQLEGWSENVMENVDDYDEVFEELYAKYRTKMHVAPEVKLIMMLGGSAMMFHLTNSMFKSVMPNMNDVIKQNPDLVKNMVSAVQNTTRGGSAPEAADTDENGEYQMKGPGMDISSLMGNIMMPPTPPMNTTSIPGGVDEPDDDVSDIVSISGESTGGEVKEVNITADKKKRGPRRKKKAAGSVEINI